MTGSGGSYIFKLRCRFPSGVELIWPKIGDSFVSIGMMDAFPDWDPVPKGVPEFSELSTFYSFGRSVYSNSPVESRPITNSLGLSEPFEIT